MKSYWHQTAVLSCHVIFVLQQPYPFITCQLVLRQSALRSHALNRSHVHRVDFVAFLPCDTDLRQLNSFKTVLKLRAHPLLPTCLHLCGGVSVAQIPWYRRLHLRIRERRAHLRTAVLSSPCPLRSERSWQSPTVYPCFLSSHYQNSEIKLTCTILRLTVRYKCSASLPYYICDAHIQAHSVPVSQMPMFFRDVLACIRGLIVLVFFWWKINKVDYPNHPAFHTSAQVAYCCCCYSAPCKWGRKILGSCCSHWNKAQK